MSPNIPTILSRMMRTHLLALTAKGVILTLTLGLTSCGRDHSPVIVDPPPPPPPVGKVAQLPIVGVFQQTAEWCWAAVGEMVLRYYGEPNVNPFGNFQCGEVGAAGAIGLLPPVCQLDCSQCVVGIGNGDRFTTFLQNYPAVARTIPGGQSARPLSVTHSLTALSLSQLTATIDAAHPVVAGVTPDNIPSPFGPAHATLIVGYDTSSPGRQLLYVNDPYPYGLGPLGPYGDPYLRRGATYIAQGRYLIDYATFAQGLFWTDSIVVQ